VVDWIDRYGMSANHDFVRPWGSIRGSPDLEWFGVFGHQVCCLVGRGGHVAGLVEKCR